ncbi:MAG: sulfotransferase [Sphingopyxis sp.]
MTEHLIHIGYPKTGSNFLRRWFEMHPQLAYTLGGIAGYQNVYAMVRDIAGTATPPLAHVTSAEAFVTPHISFGLEQVDHDAAVQNMLTSQLAGSKLLSGLFPNAHILLVTRGFRAMALSTYSQTARDGTPSSLEKFCRDITRVNLLDYDAVIAYYRAAFGADRVIILPYELLRDNPSAFLRKISDIFGMYELAPPPHRDNPSLSGVEMAWYPRISGAIRALPLPKQIIHALTRVYDKLCHTNRLRRLIKLLQWVHPIAPVGESDITDAMLSSKIKAPASLRHDPNYQAYLADYFLA